MISFIIDPSAARAAVLNGQHLLVEVDGPKQYRVKVVPPRKTK